MSRAKKNVTEATQELERAREQLAKVLAATAGDAAELIAAEDVAQEGSAAHSLRACLGWVDRALLDAALSHAARRGITEGISRATLS